VEWLGVDLLCDEGAAFGPHSSARSINTSAVDVHAQVNLCDELHHAQLWTSTLAPAFSICLEIVAKVSTSEINEAQCRSVFSKRSPVVWTGGLFVSI
jgi:hypothetical protein